MGERGRALCEYAFDKLDGLARQALDMIRPLEKDDSRVEQQRHARLMGILARTITAVARLDLPPPPPPADDWINTSGEDQMGERQSDGADVERRERKRAALEARLHRLIDQQHERAQGRREPLDGVAVGCGTGSGGGAGLGSEWAPTAA